MADNIDIKDFTAGTAVTVKTTDDSGVHTPHQIVDAVGGTVTISGTVTAELSATDNAVLDAIEADTTTLAGAVSGSEMQVDVVTSALPTGAATESTLGDIDTKLGGTLTVDGSGSTQPVSAASLPLPTGAATAANQSTANTSLAAIETAVEGTLTVDGSGVTQPVSGTITANAGTDLNTSSLALESGGNLATLAGAVSGTEMQVDIVSSALPTGAATAANQSSIETAIASLESEMATNTTAVNAVATAVEAATLELPLPYKNLDVDESEDEVKATSGKVFFIHAMNMSASVRYLKFYNATTANVTVGSTTPDFTFPIPTMADTNGAGFVLSVASGIEFDTAITIAATTGFADSDTGAPGANEVIVNLGYR